MQHNPAHASGIARRPPSAVSTGTGLVGLAGLAAWLAAALGWGLDGPWVALVCLPACGAPMLLWALLVDKVHRHPSTGIDWRYRRPWRESFDISLTKLTGLWLSWAGVAGFYLCVRFYWDGDYAFAMRWLTLAAPLLFLLSIPYMLWLDRRLIEPKDGCWALGAWLMGLDEPIDREAIFDHLRNWAIKAFFLAFMLAGLPGSFTDATRGLIPSFLNFPSDPAALIWRLVGLLFLVDVAFGTLGYLMTLRPLDAHIRTSNPYAAAWAFALLCYPPFSLMGGAGPLDYAVGNQGWNSWTAWLAEDAWFLIPYGGLLVLLTGIYAWATVAFGFRFSNLTDRGILTHGPYRWCRHPAYLAKNLFWWLATLPFLPLNDSWGDALRNTVLLGGVSGIYYVRARTEERHLLADPAYRAYYDWIERHGAIPRFYRWLAGKKPL